jgi:hypothetical protein
MFLSASFVVYIVNGMKVEVGRTNKGESSSHGAFCACLKDSPDGLEFFDFKIIWRK